MFLKIKLSWLTFIFFADSVLKFAVVGALNSFSDFVFNANCNTEANNQCD